MSSTSRGKEAYIAGLGNLKYKAPDPPCTLHEGRVKIYKDKECRKMLDKAEGGGDQLINGFCAGYLEGGIDACQVIINFVLFNWRVCVCNYFFLGRQWWSINDIR